jgi:Ufm1-specific protease 2
MLRDPEAVPAVPSILEMQQRLVNLGDKRPSFIGSTEWIGSVEVGILLDSYAGVPHTILHATDIAHLHDQLRLHFQRTATPVMIGGNGGGARTIVGIELAAAADPAAGGGGPAGGIARLLVVDPHYTGPDDAGAVRRSAGRVCAWVEPAALARQYGAFTNLCLPQLPPARPAGAGADAVAAASAAGTERPVAVAGDEWVFEVVESGCG